MLGSIISALAGQAASALFGGSSEDTESKQKTVGNQTTNQTQEETSSSKTTQDQTSKTLTSQQQQQTQDETSKALSQQQQLISQLDAQTIATLQSLVPQLAAGLGDSSNVTQQALAQLASSGADIDKIVQQSTEAAKLSANQALGQQINAIASRAGGLDNSMVQLLQQSGQQDLATKLGALEGDIRLKGAELDSQRIANAIASASGQTQNLAQIASLLKGAETSSTTQASQDTVANAISNLTGQSQSQTDTTLTQLAEAISKLIGESKTQSESTTTGSGSSTKVSGQLDTGSMIEAAKALMGG